MYIYVLSICICIHNCSSGNLFCKNHGAADILCNAIYNAICATYRHHSSVVTSSVSTSVPANNPNPALNRLTRRVTTRPQTLIINHKLQIERLRWANNKHVTFRLFQTTTWKRFAQNRTVHYQKRVLQFLAHATSSLLLLQPIDSGPCAGLSCPVNNLRLWGYL